MRLGQYVRVWAEMPNGSLVELHRGFVEQLLVHQVKVEGKIFKTNSNIFEQCETCAHELKPANLPRIKHIRCKANGVGFTRPHSKIKFRKSSVWEHRGVRRQNSVEHALLEWGL